MIASLSLGRAPARRRGHAHRIPPPHTRQRAQRGASAHGSAARAAAPHNISWETRSFALTGAAIACGFLLAILYLSQITGMSAGDYEVQRLVAQRDELRRQSALLDVQLARLDAPARIELRARELGLMRVTAVPVMNAAELLAKKK